MRKTTQRLLASCLVYGVALLVLFVAGIPLSFLLLDYFDVDLANIPRTGRLRSFALSPGPCLTMLPLFVFLEVAKVLRSTHRSWKVNLARYPALKPAIERYREEGEGVRRLLPAFVVNGGRYFLVKYGRKNREWAPGEHETGMLVLDEQGRVQDEEALLLNLLRSLRYVEESFLNVSLQGQDDKMAEGRRMARKVANARRFFSWLVRSADAPELMVDIDAFLTVIAGHVHRWAALIEGEYDWCRKNRKRVEFALEEMKPLWMAREDASGWDIETAGRIARAWAKIEGQRARLESLPGLLPHNRVRLRKVLNSLRVAAESLADAGKFKMQVAPERIEAYRSRTVKALRLEAQAQPSASAV